MRMQRSNQGVKHRPPDADDGHGVGRDAQLVARAPGVEELPAGLELQQLVHTCSSGKQVTVRLVARLPEWAAISPPPLAQARLGHSGAVKAPQQGVLCCWHAATAVAHDINTR